MESRREGLKKEQAKNDMKDSTIEELTEKELNNIKVKCVQKEEKLDENEKEILRLRKERECNEVEMDEKMKLISMRDKELNEMRTQ